MPIAHSAPLLQELLPEEQDAVPQRLRPAVVPVFGEGFASEQLQRRSVGGEGCRTRAVEASGGSVHEPFNIDDATLIVGQRVATGAGDDEPRRAGRAPGPVDQHLQVGRRVGGCAQRPQHVDQLVGSDKTAAAAGEDTQQRADLPAAEVGGGYLDAVTGNHESAHQPEVDDRCVAAAGRHRLIISDR